MQTRTSGNVRSLCGSGTTEAFASRLCGKPAFIGLAPGSGESADAWHDFRQDLKDRG